jgi:hypothetical protein
MVAVAAAFATAPKRNCMTAAYGQRLLSKDMEGDDVTELQIRLAGFRGTVPDGQFGAGTELQVQKFQQDFMAMARPTRGKFRGRFQPGGEGREIANLYEYSGVHRMLL